MLACHTDQCAVVALTEEQVALTSCRDERAGFFTHYVLNVLWCLSLCELLLSYS